MYKNNLIMSLFLIVVVMTTNNCGLQSHRSQLRALPYSQAEKLADFDTAVGYFKSYYAPLEYKEKKWNVSYPQIFSDLRVEVENTKTDAEFEGVMARLIAAMRDGHVGIRIPNQKRYSLAFATDNIDGNFVIIQVNKAVKKYGLTLGDQLVALDGETPATIVERLSRYQSIGYEGIDKHIHALMVTNRRYVQPQFNKSLVTIKRKKDGATFDVFMPWVESSNDLDKVPGLPSPKLTELSELDASLALDDWSMSIMKMGDAKPHFLNAAVLAKYSFIEAGLTDAEWAKVQIDGKPADGKPAVIYSVFYRHNKKLVYMIRIPKYGYGGVEAKRNVATYEALLKKYQSIADVLVIDQTHNPGGSVGYLEALVKLFLVKPGPGFAFSVRADRLWLRNLKRFMTTKEFQGQSAAEKAQWLTTYHDIDAANENGDFLAPPMAFSTPILMDKAVWKKPILLLIDEYCGSGGDAFPMLLKGHKRATLFGSRTMGLGGNVSQMPELPYSGHQIRLTRSLFYMYRTDYTLPDDAIIENNGVSPHIPYVVGSKDHADQFVGYVKAFSDAAVNLIKNDLGDANTIVGDANAVMIDANANL